MDAVITVDKLSLRYGELRAVDEVSLEVKQGEIFGLIGPNGAGKTSLMECIEGLRNPTSGEINILGKNPLREHSEVCKLIGVQLQDTTYQDKAKVEEICRLFSALYDSPASYLELLRKFNLLDKRKSYITKLSGGQRQRLSIVLALLPNPQIVFLDELTTGLDLKARELMWKTLKGLKEDGLTVVLSTHYMDEAEALCDRVGIMIRGKLKHTGVISDIIQQYQLPTKIALKCDAPAVLSLFNGISGVYTTYDNGVITIAVSENGKVSNILSLIQEQNIPYDDLSIIKPSLGDVYMKLTGN